MTDEEDALLSLIGARITSFEATKLHGDDATTIVLDNGQRFITFPVDSMLIEVTESWRPN